MVNVSTNVRMAAHPDRDDACDSDKIGMPLGIFRDDGNEASGRLRGIGRDFHANDGRSPRSQLFRRNVPDVIGENPVGCASAKVPCRSWHPREDWPEFGIRPV